MTRVDFYLLEDSEIDAARRFACRLCIKAIESKMTVHIQSDDEDGAKDLDQPALEEVWLFLTLALVD